MSKFITGKELDKAITDIIWYAKETLLIVSPFIKLDNHFRELFDNHANNPDVHIIIVFGKNENHVHKSMSKDDFDYFKKFLNISVVYVSNLHAKYYGNETAGVITSINLYDHSFENNIEFGVYSELKFIDNFKTSNDKLAWDTSMEIAENNEAVFIKRPVYEKKFLSAITGKRYIKSDVCHDVTDRFYSVSGKHQNTSAKKMLDFPYWLELGKADTVKPERQTKEKPQREDSKKVQAAVMETTYKKNPKTGFCIRCQRSLSFDPIKPLCNSCYREWAEWNNASYRENYCHSCGEERSRITYAYPECADCS